MPSTAYAAQITSRTLTLMAGDDPDGAGPLTAAGGSKPGGTVRHQFTFTVPSNTSIGSIKFEYCTNASDTCVTPTGLVTTGATLEAQSGISGWTLNNSTNGAPYITHSAVATTGAITVKLNSVVNPTAVNTSFFVRISTHVATNASDANVDLGIVTASTAQAIDISGVMPESLIFCTGATVSANCTTTTPGTVAFNQLFSPTDTSTATSQMAASTNAGSGYVITVTGGTLTSGANTIPAMASAAAGTRGTSQFGMNLVANTTTTSTVAVGTALAPVSEGVNLKGQPLAGYNTPDTFKYASGDIVANSGEDDANTSTIGTTMGPTNSQVYTVSYMVNVAGNQMAGTYATTLTYTCTPTF